MSDREQIKSLIKEAEVYRNQGLLEESREAYGRALKFIEDHYQYSRNKDLVDSVKDKIQTIETDLAEVDRVTETPDLPQNIQDLIKKLFSFSQNQDIAAVEGAVALAKFGQYENSLAEFQKLIQGGLHVGMEKEMAQVSHHFDSIIKHLRDSYKHIREQSTQLYQYARELSQSYEKIKEEKEIRDRLSRYVGQNLVERVLTSKDGVLFQNERKEVTVLFADIRSFTAMSERMAAEAIVSMLNEFFSAMVDIVFKNNGVLDKFVGDQIMAVFGLLGTDRIEPCYDAVKTAVDMQNATEKLMHLRHQQGKETFAIGIGINTGSAIVGNVGSRNRMDYTVIGDCVNVAGRLQQMAEGGEIIIGEETHRKAGDHFRTKKRGRLRLKNKAEPVLCYRVLR